MNFYILARTNLKLKFIKNTTYNSTSKSLNIWKIFKILNREVCVKSSVIKMSIFLRLIYRFNVIPSKTLAGFLEENDKMIKFIWKSSWKKKLENSHYLVSTQYKLIVIKIVWYWLNDKDVDQWNKIEIPEIDWYRYGKLFFDKGATVIQWGKNFQ